MHSTRIITYYLLLSEFNDYLTKAEEALKISDGISEQPWGSYSDARASYDVNNNWTHINRLEIFVRTEQDNLLAALNSLIDETVHPDLYNDVWMIVTVFSHLRDDTFLNKNLVLPSPVAEKLHEHLRYVQLLFEL